MKTKLFVILFIAAILIGCNPIPNKSIFEELSTKELAKAIDKEPKFESCYKMVQEQIIPKLHDKVELAKYADVTYRRLYDYMLYVNDDNNFTPYFDKAVKEWEETFGSKEYDVDSVINLYRQQFEFENNLQTPNPSTIVPSTIKDYIEYEEKHPGEDNIYRGQVIKEFIDKDYMAGYEATGKAGYQFMKDRDEKCYRLFMLSIGLDPDTI